MSVPPPKLKSSNGGEPELCAIEVHNEENASHVQHASKEGLSASDKQRIRKQRHRIFLYTYIYWIWFLCALSIVCLFQDPLQIPLYRLEDEPDVPTSYHGTTCMNETALTAVMITIHLCITIYMFKWRKHTETFYAVLLPTIVIGTFASIILVICIHATNSVSHGSRTGEQLSKRRFAPEGYEYNGNDGDCMLYRTQYHIYAYAAEMIQLITYIGVLFWSFIYFICNISPKECSQI